MREISSDPKSTEHAANVPPISAAMARCLRCGHDLNGLPDAARYCPRCGLDSFASPPAAIVAHVADGSRGLSDLFGGWEHLFQIAEPPSTPPLPESFPSPASTTEMVKSYGNALYRLGQRYEMGVGAFRNSREAFRCYFKSARLGNVLALGRLAAQVFLADKAEPSQPNPSHSPEESAGRS